MDAASNELLKPLGLDRDAPPRRRLSLPVARSLAAGLLMAAAGIGLYVAIVDDPHGGEPHALVAISTPPPAAEAKPDQTAGRTSVAPPARSDAVALEAAAGVAVVRPGGATAPASVLIQVPDQPSAGLAPAPDPRLVERTRQGTLPKVATDGARASDVYARRSGTLPGGARPAGRVALLVGGLGISAAATADAVAKLPAPVTLAFAPYGSDLDRQAARAREDGHEVMLQAPMEPFDYPDNDPGPHTLTVGARPDDNLERLHWVMGRFSGYVGLVNFMGARLTADEAALTPLLREVGRRGLAFLDDGSSQRSLAATVGPSVQTPTARADVVLDGAPRADMIDRELARLEQIARDKGLAIGTASAMPVSVERIARWAQGLESRGILLVPVSAAYRREGGL